MYIIIVASMNTLLLVNVFLTTCSFNGRMYKPYRKLFPLKLVYKRCIYLQELVHPANLENRLDVTINGLCINEDNVCNGVNNCGDSSDEEQGCMG